ncbi:hypothetical protein L3Q82_016160 [Scortum barcoo]|uniref:Uncharacterized protein n=1 Tax=Scortum barcoo TaxID=214431 RepID=A0ACB8VQD7_9TELE|nr:hypothetical protein L3Q82_016160 [Scortum barcoo]
MLKSSAGAEGPSFSQDSDKCLICLSPFVSQAVASLQNCQHVFCLECILQWSQTANTCPVDRISFSFIHQRRRPGGEIQKKIKVRTRKTVDDDEEEEEDGSNAVICEECGRSDCRHRLLVCTQCDSGYHMDCLAPSLNTSPEGDWTCPDCVLIPQHTDISVVEEEISDGELTDLLAEVDETAPTSSRLRPSTVNRPGSSTERRHSRRIQNRAGSDPDPRPQTSWHVPKYLLRASKPAVTTDEAAADTNNASEGKLSNCERQRREKERSEQLELLTPVGVDLVDRHSLINLTAGEGSGEEAASFRHTQICCFWSSDITSILSVCGVQRGTAQPTNVGGRVGRGVARTEEEKEEEGEEEELLGSRQAKVHPQQTDWSSEVERSTRRQTRYLLPSLLLLLLFFSRANIDEVETEVVEIEAKLDKLVKLCSGMIEAGKAYVSANKLFVSGIRDLSQQCKKDEMISECLEKCGESLQEIINYHMILFDQAQRSVKQQLHNFVKEDVRKFKETKKHFDRVREDMEIAQVKNAQAPRNKPHEVEEAAGTLSITRKCFRHLALDYVLQINVLQAKKKFEILDAMLSFMHAQYSLFQQGYNLLDEIDPYMKKLAAELDQLVIDSAMEKREMEHKHATIQQRDFSYDDSKVEFNVDAPNGVVMEGYLFKRASNAFKTWNRLSIKAEKWRNEKLFVCGQDSLTVVVEDLRLCSVKPCEDIERRFCFEVVSPSKSCMLQAESEKLRQAWIQAVQASIASAYRESPDTYYIEHLDRTASPSTSSIDSASEPRERSVRGETILQRIQCLPGNEQCCDCGQADPRWASINLGILLCIECSGIHRSLGVHCSKVRSLTLDSWEPELLKLMCELGNSVINHIYEGSYQEQGLKKPLPSSSRQEKEAWIKAKYVEKKFLKKLGSTEILINGERKSERRWSVKKCRRHNSATTVPKTRRRYRQEPGSTSPSTLSAAAAKFRRDSLFCPDELDSLFSYFDTGSGPRSLSSDSGLGGSTDGSTDILVFGSVVDSVTEECELTGRTIDVNLVNDEDEGKTPLIQAVIGGSLIACEFLLQNAADVNQRDVRGRGPLHHATYLGHTGQVCLFLKRGATQNDEDEDGQDPLSIAVQQANADIVTLLRLARMNEEMRESEGPFGQPVLGVVAVGGYAPTGSRFYSMNDVIANSDLHQAIEGLCVVQYDVSVRDATYLDIFREFSHMASHNPEKLKRRSVHFRHSFR